MHVYFLSCPGRGAARKRCTAEPGPTLPLISGVWAPAWQRTTVQEYRAALHPGRETASSTSTQVHGISRMAVSISAGFTHRRFSPYRLA
jgi:hypothetical protein